MPSIEVNERAAAATLPSKHPGVSRNPSIKMRQVKTIRQSRRSLAQKSTAKLDTLLTIVDDNRDMYKRYLVDRVPTIDVTGKGTHLLNAQESASHIDVGYTWSNVPRFRHQAYHAS